MKLNKLCTVLFLLVAVAVTTVAQAEEKAICSNNITAAKIDGYDMTKTGGNLHGGIKLQQQRGSFSIRAEGISTLNEKIILSGGTKIYAVARHDGAIILYGTTEMLTVVEGNARMGLPKVATYIYWQPQTGTVAVVYDHPHLELTEITYQQTDC